MLMPSAQSNIILRPFGNHGYLTRVEPCHIFPHHQMNVRYCKCNVLSCYIKKFAVRKYDYHATVSKYNCLGNQEGIKLSYIQSD